LGETPYSAITRNRDVVEHVLSGKRLPRPTECPEPVWVAMVSCWSENADDRPSFKNLMIDLDRYYSEVFMVAQPSPEKDVTPSQSKIYQLSTIERKTDSGYQTLSSAILTKEGNYDRTSAVLDSLSITSLNDYGLTSQNQ
jgi:hypothetical protein